MRGGGLLSEIQDELFRAPHEDSRPKAAVPCKTSVATPTAAPAIPPKRRHSVSDHNDLGAYVAAGLGRVMMLDSILIAVRLEDPFYDKGRYPVEMSLAEYAKGEWRPTSPPRVKSEYDRLSVYTDSTMSIERRCAADYHDHYYAKLLRAAIEQLQATLEDLSK